MAGGCRPEQNNNNQSGRKKMKTFMTLLSVLAMTSILQAQGMGRMGGGGMGNHRFYDTKTIVTISGTITSVDKISSPRENSYGIHLQVEASDGTITTYVGPSWYLNEQKISFKNGDKVEITGSKVRFSEKDIILAAAIKSGGKTIQLRDDAGHPVWSRRGMK